MGETTHGGACVGLVHDAIDVFVQLLSVLEHVG
jgi:hypothetical protein